MFERLARSLFARRRAALALSLIALVVLGSIGTLLFSRMQTGGYSDPGSDSARVWSVLQEDFKVEAPSVVLIVDSQSGNAVSNTAAATEVERAVKNSPGVARTVSFWSSGNRPEFLSKDGKAGYLFVYLKDSPSIDETSAALQKEFDGDRGNLHIYATGFGVFSSSVNNLVKSDLAKSESIAIPISMLLLVIVLVRVMRFAILLLSDLVLNLLLVVILR